MFEHSLEASTSYSLSKIPYRNNMEKVHKRYFSWYCTCKGLLSGVRANNWGAFLGNGSVPRKKIHCTDGEK